MLKSFTFKISGYVASNYYVIMVVLEIDNYSAAIATYFDKIEYLLL